jgi:glycosyltransferase involved in cell wall biosynthesis
VPEVIDDGITGYAVEPDDGFNAISRAVRLDRRRARQRFEERFTARRMAEDYLRIYESLLETDRGANLFEQFESSSPSGRHS